MGQNGKAIKKATMMKLMGGNKLEVLYFAELKDIANQQSETIDVSKPLTVEAFKVMIVERYPEMAHKQFQIAVNEEFVKLTDYIKPGDTVALIPPVSGG